VQFNVGDKITVKEFQPGQYVDVIGTGKGKGFQGVVRRHKFAGGDMTHGAKGWHRRGGAIGQRLFPGRVFKNMRMPGHMGDRRVTTQNLRVVQCVKRTIFYLSRVRWRVRLVRLLLSAMP